MPPPPVSQAATGKPVTFAKVPERKGQRTALYGPGGIGKTTLLCQPDTVFFDLEESLSVLSVTLAESELEIPPIVPGIKTFKDVRDALKSSGWDAVKNIVIDTGTKLEEMAVAQTCRDVRGDKGAVCKNVEDYGFGKGYHHVYNTFVPILADLDVHVRAGRNVFIICHDCVSNVPNPNGEDWIRYEPRLQNPKSGKDSIRLRVREWCDHLLFFSYDISVDEDKKAKSSGSRTLYTSERAFCMAKSRTTSQDIVIEKGGNPWPLIIK